MMLFTFQEVWSNIGFCLEELCVKMCEHENNKSESVETVKKERGNRIWCFYHQHK